MHANVRLTFGPLRWLIATPQFHHWHHAREPEAYNSNYAGEFPAVDALFGTLYLPVQRWPTQYGIDEHEPAGYLRNSCGRCARLSSGLSTASRRPEFAGGLSARCAVLAGHAGHSASARGTGLTHRAAIGLPALPPAPPVPLEPAGRRRAPPSPPVPPSPPLPNSPALPPATPAVLLLKPLQPLPYSSPASPRWGAPRYQACHCRPGGATAPAPAGNNEAGVHRAGIGAEHPTLEKGSLTRRPMPAATALRRRSLP